MSKDLIFGKTHRNWSRKIDTKTPGIVSITASTVSITATVSPAVEKTARLNAIKEAADKGNKKAQKKWSKICKKVAKLHLKAAKGDLKAAKQLAALNSTGLFATTINNKSLKTSVLGSFVGRDEILGSFVGNDILTEIVGNDKLTEIVSSGAFVGDDRLAEIISKTVVPTTPTEKQKSKVESSASIVKRFQEHLRLKGKLGETLRKELREYDKSLPADQKVDMDVLGASGDGRLAEIISKTVVPTT